MKFIARYVLKNDFILTIEMEFEIPSVVFNTLNFEDEFNCTDIHNFIPTFRLCLVEKVRPQVFDYFFEMCAKNFTFHIDSFAGSDEWLITLYVKSSDIISYHWICIVDSIEEYNLVVRKIIDSFGSFHYVRGDDFSTYYSVDCPECFY